MEKLKEKIQETSNNAKRNEDIFNKYTEKAKQETKKGNKTLIISLIIGVLIFALLGVGFPLIAVKIEKSQERDVPNLEGKTFEEAQKELTNLGLKLEVTFGNSDKNSIITSQNTKYKAKKGETIKVYTSTKEEIEKRKQADKKYQEEKSAISKAITKFAEIVERDNNGSVKYSTYEIYDGIETTIGTHRKLTDTTVYKITYTTSSKGVYYYQLVSINTDNTAVQKSTKLFLFSDYGYGETGQTQELEYAYKNTF